MVSYINIYLVCVNTVYLHFGYIMFLWVLISSHVMPYIHKPAGFCAITHKLQTRTIDYLLPPRAFCSSLVSTESRYGTSTFFLPMERSAKACKFKGNKWANKISCRKPPYQKDLWYKYMSCLSLWWWSPFFVNSFVQRYQSEAIQPLTAV